MCIYHFESFLMSWTLRKTLTLQLNRTAIDLICLHILHLNLEELSLVERLDNELRLTLFALLGSQSLVLLEFKEFLVVTILDIVGEVKAILDLEVLSG